MQLFNRAVTLSLTRIASNGSESEATTITGLRVQFQIEKHLGKEPNSCEIVITNLSARSRAELEHKPTKVRLSAGYEGNESQLFAGDLRWSESLRVGADWESKILIGDGDRAYRYARLSKSYKAGVNQKTILKDTADAMGFKIPSNVSEGADFLKQTVTGITVDGHARDQLDRIANVTARDWSIQDDTLVMLKPNETRAGITLVVNADNGMIGSPSFGSPPEKGKPRVLAIKTLLRPDIAPGARLQVESIGVNGAFKIQRVLHSGDTAGLDWYSDIEATPL